MDLSERVTGECPERLDGSPHHWHQPTEQVARISRKGIPVRICCFCGAIIAEAFDVKEGCGPYVMDPSKDKIAT